jgi:hypothetical protein
MMRKRVLGFEESPGTREIPIASVATVLVSSEDVDHPIDHAFDHHGGPGGTRWIAGKAGEQTVEVAFDAPQSVRQVYLEVEERDVSRTQELELLVSTDGGKSYRELLRQEFNFSPQGATFEREEWTISEADVTHLRIRVKPDKGGRSCLASLTSLGLT